MTFTKVYNGAGSGATAGDYSDSRNWELISLRNPAFVWTASGSGTNEYYVALAGPADPGFIATPPTSNGVYINSAVATKNATLGSLAAGEWGYGDNDSNGYDTVYVRLSDGTDPDSKAADYVQFRQIPQIGEQVRIPSSAGSITSGLDQSDVLVGFTVEDGYSGTIGSVTSYFRLKAVSVYINSIGQSWIDVGSQAATITVDGTGTGDEGEFGLSLRGTAITLVDARGGSVGIAAHPGELSTLTTLRISNRGTTVKCGSGCTLTSVIPMFDGELWLHCSATTVTKYGGKVYLKEAAAVTTVNDLGPGEFHYGSSGNITTYNMRGGGLLNMRASNVSRTLTTLNTYFNSGTIVYNKEAVTITNDTKNDSYTATITN